MLPKFTSCPTLLSTPPTPIKYLINQLIPKATMVLMHGDPRTKKSYTALELAIAGATGSSAFGFPRFQATNPSRVLYLSQEDPEHVVRERIRNILLDREIDPPDNLFFGIHRGINLDVGTCRDYLFGQAKAEGYDMMFIDPIRRFTANADKGPSEVTPVTTFLRRFCVELDTTVGILHHNVKPLLMGGNGRKESYNASGGDWFASCECPISFRSNGDSWTHVTPLDYKLSSSPESFDVQVIEDQETGRLHLKGRDSGEGEREDRILVFLTNNPKSSENSIATGCKLKRSTVPSLLLNCQSKGLISCEEGSNKSRLWSVQ